MKVALFVLLVLSSCSFRPKLAGVKMAEPQVLCLAAGNNPEEEFCRAIKIQTAEELRLLGVKMDAFEANRLTVTFKSPKKPGDNARIELDFGQIVQNGELPLSFDYEIKVAEYSASFAREIAKIAAGQIERWFEDKKIKPENKTAKTLNNRGSP